MLRRESHFLLIMLQGNSHDLFCYIITHRVNIVFPERKQIRVFQSRWKTPVKNLGHSLHANVRGLTIVHYVPRRGWKRKQPGLHINHFDLMSVKLLCYQVIYCSSSFHLSPFFSIHCVYMKILKPMRITSINSTAAADFSTRSVS